MTQERIEENRSSTASASVSRSGGRGGYQITPTTRRLLDHWRETERERRLFFCQIEALETAIYITEVAAKIRGQLDRQSTSRCQRQFESTARPRRAQDGDRDRKTVVMAMLIAWHTLNKVANTQDRKFSDLPDRYWDHHSRSAARSPA
ncbi:MAG: hypothetical protein R2849_00905 [Thermomicrobiales bacterium]